MQQLSTKSGRTGLVQPELFGVIEVECYRKCYFVLFNYLISLSKTMDHNLIKLNRFMHNQLRIINAE
jgi:hypothetical protein